MTEVKHVCVHFLSGNCKFGDRCTKAHTNSTPDLLLEIDKKGTAICNYHPTCIFSAEDCKRLHVISKNNINNEMNEMKTYYSKIMEIQTTDQNKLYQIERVRNIIKLDSEFVKQTYECLKNM